MSSSLASNSFISAGRPPASGEFNTSLMQRPRCFRRDGEIGFSAASFGSIKPKLPAAEEVPQVENVSLPSTGAHLGACGGQKGKSTQKKRRPEEEPTPLGYTLPVVPVLMTASTVTA